MAHRIAELIEASEAGGAESEEAKKQCAGLIIKLWEHRAEWPHGGPLSFVLPAFRKMTGETRYPGSYRTPKSDGSWAGALSTLEWIHEKEMAVVRSAAMADIPQEAVESDRNLVDAHNEALSGDERELITVYLKMIDNLHDPDFSLGDETPAPFGSLTPEERTERTKSTLEKLADERKRLIESCNSNNGMQTTEGPGDEQMVAPGEEEVAERLGL